MSRGTISEEERRAWNVLLKGGFVAMVAVSAALIGLQGGAALLEIGALTLVGGAVGLALLWYLSRMEF